ncbi:hypothetical protein Tco_1439717, partial [Tanacetum coccineum]
DDLIIVVDDSDEDKEDDKGEEVHTTLNVETKDASVLNPPSPSSLPTELKELPSKFNELTEEVKGLKKQVHELEIELPGDSKEIPTKLEDFTKTVTSHTSQVLELKTLQWELPPEFLSMPTQVKMAIASKKTEDANVPLTGQAGTQPAEGEKNTNKTTISRLFQRKSTKNSNLTKQQSKPTPPPTIPIIPPVITTTTTQMQSPSLQNPQKGSSQPKGEHIKKDKGKKSISLEEVKKESTNSDFDDDENHLTGSVVESSRIKKVKKFDFVIKGGKHIHLTKEEINKQKKIEEDAKVEATKHESEGPITLKVYKEDGTSKVIPNFKASDLHLGEWREVMNACLNRTGKGWKIIYEHIQKKMDYIHASKAELGIDLDIPLSEQD